MVENLPHCSTVCIAKYLVLVALCPRGRNINWVILPTSSKVHRDLIILSIISLIWLKNIDPKCFVAQAPATRRHRESPAGLRA